MQAFGLQCRQTDLMVRFARNFRFRPTCRRFALALCFLKIAFRSCVKVTLTGETLAARRRRAIVLLENGSKSFWP